MSAWGLTGCINCFLRRDSLLSVRYFEGRNVTIHSIHQRTHWSCWPIGPAIDYCRWRHPLRSKLVLITEWRCLLRFKGLLFVLTFLLHNVTPLLHVLEKLLSYILLLRGRVLQSQVRVWLPESILRWGRGCPFLCSKLVQQLKVFVIGVFTRPPLICLPIGNHYFENKELLMNC